MNGLVGVIHSGWQGTVKEITPKLFQHLMKEEQCRPEDFHVQIGMALSQQKFEVDADVYEKFHSLGYAEEFMYCNAETKKYHIDNQQTVKNNVSLRVFLLNKFKLMKPVHSLAQMAFLTVKTNKQGDI